MIVEAAGAEAAAHGFVTKFQNAILFPLMGVMMATAILIFLWGAFQFVYNADNDSERETGKKHMIYGIIGLLVMLSAYGILQIAAKTFDVPIPT